MNSALGKFNLSKNEPLRSEAVFGKDITSLSPDFELKLGQMISLLRKVAHVSQTELAGVIGVHQTALCRVEKGTQKLNPEQLYVLSEFFDVKIDSLLAFQVDFWRVGERFGRALPIPRKYVELPYQKIRETLPFLHFLRDAHGEKKVNEVLNEIGINEVFVRNPDMTIGTRFGADLIHTLTEKRLLEEKDYKIVASFARTELVQGSMHSIYTAQNNWNSLIQLWALNHSQYGQSFNCSIDGFTGDKIQLSFRKSERLKNVDFGKIGLTADICTYRKTYISELPLYIGHGAVSIHEKNCMFHGDHSECKYEVSVA